MVAFGQKDTRSAKPPGVMGYELEPGDLLFARSGATVGKTHLHRPQDGPCVTLAISSGSGQCPAWHCLSSWDSGLPRMVTVAGSRQCYVLARSPPSMQWSTRLCVSLPQIYTKYCCLDSVNKSVEGGIAETDVLGLLKATAADALLTGGWRVRSYSG